MPFAEITRGITVPPAAPPIDRRAAAQRTQGRAAGAGAAPADAFQRAGVAPGAAVAGANPAAGRACRSRWRQPRRWPWPAAPCRCEPRRGRPRRAASACAAAGRRRRCIPRQRLGQHGRRAAVGRQPGSSNGPPALPGSGHGPRRQLRLGRATVFADRPSIGKAGHEQPECLLRSFRRPSGFPWLGMRTNRNLTAAIQPERHQQREPAGGADADAPAARRRFLADGRRLRQPGAAERSGHRAPVCRQRDPARPHQPAGARRCSRCTRSHSSAPRAATTTRFRRSTATSTTRSTPTSAT